MVLPLKQIQNDTRESPAIKVCKDLINEGAFLSIHDPKVLEEQIKEDLGNSIFLNKSNLSSNPLWEKKHQLKRLPRVQMQLFSLQRKSTNI